MRTVSRGRNQLKAWELQGPGGVDEMRLVEKPVPVPGRGQVLVKLTAALPDRDDAEATAPERSNDSQAASRVIAQNKHAPRHH